MRNEQLSLELDTPQLGYSPDYEEPAFTDFGRVTPDTPLEKLNLNWRECDLPEHLRTKHVHRLHPYLGKFIPQLVEIFLRKYVPRVVCDPFCGSGTTLVEANALGVEAIGCDICAFNCLLSRAKTAAYDLRVLERDIYDVLQNLNEVPDLDTDNEYLRSWYAPRARAELLYFRSLISHYTYPDLFKVILSRAARSARLTTHFNLDFPRVPQTEPYYCYKHGRICQPTQEAKKFLVRYSLDTFRRVREAAIIRTEAPVTVIHGDARTVTFPGPIDCVITSPPYVGLIDYHKQHQYAYELLGLEWREDEEIGSAVKGTSPAAKSEYIQMIGDVLRNLRGSLTRDSVVVIVVHDRQNLYKDLAEALGFFLESHLQRHVNRRTGRRAHDFFEEILIWRLRDA